MTAIIKLLNLLPALALAGMALTGFENVPVSPLSAFDEALSIHYSSSKQTSWLTVLGIISVALSTRLLTCLRNTGNPCSPT